MQEVIGDLYRVFKPYRLGDDFSGCDHCVSESDSQRLASISLGELTVTDVNRYAFKAMTTWGTERHFKHFLPRLLELAVDDYMSYDFPEVLLGKLAYANWRSWPKAERNAIAQFLETFWVHQLNYNGDFPTDERIRTVLGGLAEACTSISDYLTLWHKCAALNPALHCAQLVHDCADDIMTTGTLELWGQLQAQCAELVAWISSDRPRRLLGASYDTITETFPLVFDQLDGIRAATSTQ
jgi:hypothetical protein